VAHCADLQTRVHGREEYLNLERQEPQPIPQQGVTETRGIFNDPKTSFQMVSKLLETVVTVR
jgi:hypothetical protein